MEISKEVLPEGAYSAVSRNSMPVCYGCKIIATPKGNQETVTNGTSTTGHKINTRQKQD